MAVHAFAGGPGALDAQVREPVVHAILFYSPACPHCHEVMTEDLPPMADRYGDRLVMVGVDVTSLGGQELFDATADFFGIPPSERGVPLLVVGSEVLMGSLEIPERLPGIIEEALAHEGLDWPAVPLVRTALARQGLLEEEVPAVPTPPAVAAADSTVEPAPSAAVTKTAPAMAEPPSAPPNGGEGARSAETSTAPEPASSPEAGARGPVVPSSEHAVDEAGIGADVTPPPEPSPGEVDAIAKPLGSATVATLSVMDRLRVDPTGNGMAVVVLMALVTLVALVARHLVTPLQWLFVPRARLIPVLCAVGVGVAMYLAWVEITGARAVCGPVGDCNTVQQSEYARLFGVIPVAVLGLAAYLAMAGVWGLSLRRRFAARATALWLLWGMALAATVFSVYLTFLEPFVIGATCAWCVTSSLVSGGLLVLATAEVRPAALPPDHPPPTVASAA